MSDVGIDFQVATFRSRTFQRLVSTLWYSKEKDEKEQRRERLLLCPSSAVAEAGTEATTNADFARKRPSKKAAFYCNGHWQSKPLMTLSIQIGMGIEVSIKM